MPGADIYRDYQVVFNGFAVQLPEGDKEAIFELMSLPGVKAVLPQQEYEPNMYASLPLIGAPALWDELEGQENAGEGVKVAVIDTGIYITHTCFAPTGYAYPAGYPLMDDDKPAVTNEKVIVARAYFRPDDPPATGNEGTWPGETDSSHGTHTAGTIACNADTVAEMAAYTETISGVAPRAQLMSYKIFYTAESGSGSGWTAELVAAIEDAVADGADVVNNSWGGGTPMAHPDPIDIAYDAAWDAGVVVVFSAGNSGPNNNTTDHVSLKNISVGATTSGGTIASGEVSVTAPEPLTETLQSIAFTTASFGEPLPAGEVYTFTLASAAVISPTNFEGCNPWPADTFDGRAALISRGACNFDLKVYNAQEAGAEFVIVHNHATGGDELINMGAANLGDQITIPSIFIGHTAGVAMTDWINDYGDNSELTYDAIGFQLGNDPDRLAAFSSRGPGMGNLQPDLVAPGVNIFSSGYGVGTGEARHMGFGQISGTSMAAPHVSGSAALLLQLYPDWTPDQIRSALMSTGELDLLDYDESEVGALDRGSGRIDLSKAWNPGLTFDMPSVSFGKLYAGDTGTMDIVATDVYSHSDPFTYTIAISETGDITTTGYFTIGVDVDELVVDGEGDTANFTVSVDVAENAPAGDYEGMIWFTLNDHVLHIPVWVRVWPELQEGTVLVIDNDGSYTLGFNDYAAYYTQTLELLEVPYHYYDADMRFANAQTIPDLSVLQSYDAIIWFTGDNWYPDGYFTVHTPLTEMDQLALIAYLQGGGRLLATGQDLAWVLDAVPGGNPATSLPSFFGVGWAQDNVFSGTVPSEIHGMGLPFAENMRLNVVTDTAWYDGAGNQTSIDEIYLPETPEGQPEERNPARMIFQAAEGDFAAEGHVGAVKSAEPRLEIPETDYDYRIAYLSFGFEGVNNATGTLFIHTLREELMGELLNFLLLEPTVSLPDTVEATINVAETFVAESDSDVSQYRWDFGDGSAIMVTAEPTVTHVYAVAGVYTARVEVTDKYDHKALASSSVMVEDPALTAEFSATPLTGIVPLTVTFTDESVNDPTSWLWDFGDGVTSTAQHPTHTYSEVGVYTVTLIVENDDGSDTITKPGYITVTVPGIALSPSALNTTLSPGGVATRTLNIESVGSADLTWTTTINPATSWLSAIPAAGTLAPSSSIGVAVVFDADGLSSGVYTTTLQVNSNDPDEPQIDVPVALTVLSSYFTLNIEPPAHGVTQGDSVAYTVTLMAYEGFNASVDLSVSGLPADASASFTDDSLTPTSSTLMTVDTTASTPAGDYVLWVRGVSGDITRLQDVILSVQAPPTGQTPVVTAIEPENAYNDQPTDVNISGSNFVATPQVYLGSTRLLNVIFVNSTSLRATVPANMNTGVYNLKVINPGGQIGEKASAFTVEQYEQPDVSYIMPVQGSNDTPVVLSIFGYNFAADVTVTLSSPTTTVPLVDLERVNAGYLRGSVPAGSQSGVYDLIAVNSGAWSDTLSAAYTVLDASTPIDDLYASSQNLWVNPITPRKGESAKLGLLVERLGGKQPVTTTVRFYDGSPDNDKLIGEAETPFITAGGLENTAPVTWTPAAAGSYAIYAVIDHDNQVNEQPSSAENNNVVSRTFTVLTSSPDTSPPRVDDLTINDGVARTRVISVSLDSIASEMLLPNQSGVSKIRYEEFEYNQGASAWVLVQRSGWLDYASSHVNYPWTLIESSGVHYMRAWAADAAGNVSVSPAVDFINYAPSAERVAAGAVNLYRQDLSAGEQLIVRLTPTSGDPDLYVWPPDWRDGAWASINGGTDEDVVSFIAPEDGLYQIEVFGYTAAEYSLNITVNANPVTLLAMHDSPALPSSKIERGAPMIEAGDAPSNEMARPEAPEVAQSGVALSPGYSQDANPGAVVTYTHVLTNTGGNNEIFEIEASAPEGWDVELLGGAYPTGTLILPLQIASHQTATFVVSLTVPTGAPMGAYTTLVTASSAVSETTKDTLTDTTIVKRAAGVAFGPDNEEGAEPDSVVVYTHTLANTGNYTDTFDLTHHSSQGWEVTYTTPITLGIGLTRTVWISITAPSEATSGTVDVSVITATSRFSDTVYDTVTDTTIVKRAAGVAFGPDNEESAEPDSVVVYTHTLANTGNHTDTFDLTHHSSQGWGVTYTTPITLGIGLTRTVWISITAPSEEISGTVDVSIITATSRFSDTVYDTVTDTTTITSTARHHIFLPLVIRS